MNADKPISPQLPGSLDIAMSNTAKKPSHDNHNALFFRLPPELRNRVYEYVLEFESSRTPRPLQDPRTPRPLRAVVTRAYRLPDMLVDREPSILHVYRAIRAEARGIYYSDRRFIATILPGKIPLFAAWAFWADLSRVNSVALYIIAKQPFEARTIYPVAHALRQLNMPAGKLSGSLPVRIRERAVATGWNIQCIFHRYPVAPVFDLLVELAVAHSWDEPMVHAWASRARPHYNEDTLVQFWQKLKAIEHDRTHAWSQAKQNLSPDQVESASSRSS